MNNNRIITVLLFVVIGCLSFASAQTDSTQTPGAKGRDVTEAVIRKIKRSAIFGEDSDFTRRTAWVETRFGDDPKTYRDGYHGGIWQADEHIYNSTKNTTGYPGLTTLHSNISTVFGINWSATSWQSLRSPLHSALALRMFFAAVIQEPIPGTLNNQSALWKMHYRKENPPTQQDYINLIRELEKEPVCKGRMDICIVLDGSGSVQRPNFEIAKGFVADLVNTFDIGVENVKTGFVEYSTNAVTIIPVENSFNKTHLDSLIRNTRYSAGNTNTPAGINRAVDLLIAANPRSGVPRVMTVLTDGQSNIGHLPTAIERAQRLEIYSFAVGIGTGIVSSELLQIAYGDPTHVFELTGFDGLAEFFYRLNSETCLTPQKPELNDTVEESLNQGERRFYLYALPTEGVTVNLTLTAGETKAYYSYTEEVPSSAINDGEYSGQGLFYIPFKDAAGGALNSVQSRKFLKAGETQTVYLAVEGIQTQNQYKMEILSGNKVPSSGMSIQAICSTQLIIIYILATWFNL